jgi:hypothetical protein
MHVGRGLFLVKMYPTALKNLWTLNSDSALHFAVHLRIYLQGCVLTSHPPI